MKGIGDVLILGGVAAAGYLLLQSGGEGGESTVQYIRNIPRAISPGVKEVPPTPTIIQFPSETVNFPAPKLPSVTSLLPPMPTKTQPVVKTQPVTSTPKKEKKYTEPSPESWEKFTTEVWGAKPDKYSKKAGGLVPPYEMVKTFGFPQSYLDWLKNPYSVPGGKKQPTIEDIPQAWNPQATFYEQIGGISGGSSSTKKSKKVKESPYWEQAMKEPERFSERSVWDVSKKIESKKKTTTTTTSKKTAEKKPPSISGVTWVKKGSGWTATRSRASFVRSFGW